MSDGEFPDAVWLSIRERTRAAMEAVHSGEQALETDALLIELADRGLRVVDA